MGFPGDGALRRGVVGLLLLFGCARTMKPEVPTQAPDAVLELARQRPVPDPLQAKYAVKIRSEKLDLAGSTNGVLIVDRPGKGHLAILGPLGGPIFTLSSDGTGVSVVLPRERRHLLALDAEVALQEVGAGLVGLDELFGLLVGDVPFDDARVQSRSKEGDDRVRVELAGPNDTTVTVVLRMIDGTPESFAVHRATGEPVLGAVFSPYQALEGGALMPTAVAVEVPSLDLRLELTYRSWSVLGEVPPVFGLEAPAGFGTESLEQALKDMAQGLALRALATPQPASP